MVKYNAGLLYYMVHENILSSYVGSEVTIRLQGKKHASGILEQIKKGTAYVKITKKQKRKIPTSEIKGIEGKPFGHGDFEKKVNSLIETMIKRGEAKDEKEAIDLIKKRFF